MKSSLQTFDIFFNNKFEYDVSKTNNKHIPIIIEPITTYFLHNHMYKEVYLYTCRRSSM